MESWTDIGELLDEADLSGQMLIAQHFVRSMEQKAADATAKTGTFVSRIFPEPGPLSGDLLPPNATGPLSGGTGNRAELNENDVVLQFGEKAPPVGLEQSPISPGFPHSAESTSADFSAPSEGGSMVDPDLAAVLDAWSGLSDPIKAGILALVKASQE